MGGTTIFFAFFSFLAILFSILVVSFKNPVSSAFSLVMVLFNVAAVFAIQDAHFAAAVQILVYAGAIAVLFVFVIMLLNIDVVPLDFPKAKLQYWLAGAISVTFFLVACFVIVRGGSSSFVGPFTAEAVENAGGNIKLISQRMFTGYLFSFELVALLLTLAIVGSIVLAKRKVD
jgi:NADH-quinone oxidoreductase subunit J